MKTILSILFVVLVTATLNAQKLKAADVPAAVKATMTKTYPAVKEIKWEKEDANFEAEFKLNGIEMSVLFDAEGNLEETETEIAVSSLPKAVTDYVAANYAGCKMEEGAKIVDGNGVIMYEAEVKKGKRKI